MKSKNCYPVKWNSEWRITILMIILILILASCQKTPDNAAVVYRGDGLPEDAVITAVPEGELKVIDAPEYWTETMERSEGKILIEADNALVQVPEISNTPVVELAQSPFSNEQLKELVDYFAGDYKIYKRPAMTKTELEEKNNMIETGEGIYGVFSYDDRKDMLNRLEELIEKAPKDQAEKEYTTATFTYPVLNERTYVGSGNKIDRTVRTDNDEALSITEKNTLDVHMDTGQATDPSIIATQYNSTAGSNSNFFYKTGATYDENYIQEEEEMIRSQEEMTPSDSDKQNIADRKQLIANIKEITKDVSITSEQAQELAQQMLDALNISDISLDSCVKGAHWIPKQNEWDKYNIEMSSAKGGYSLTYYRKVGNLTSCIGGTPLSTNLPEQTYSPTFFPEIITIFVTEDGIQSFGWYNMAQISGIVAENTELLSFDQIKNRMADHLGYMSLPPAEYMDSMEYGAVKHTVKNVELRVGYVDAFNEPDKAWMVPVWVFTVQYSYKSGEKYIARGWTETVMIHALDGGYVSMGNDIIQFNFQ